MSDSSVSVTYKGAEIANITESGTTTLKTAGTYCEDDIGLVAQLSGGASLQEKTITENGAYTPDSGYDGLSKVTVNVQTGGDLDGGTGTDAFKYGRSYANNEFTIDTGLFSTSAIAVKALRGKTIPTVAQIDTPASFAYSYYGTFVPQSITIAFAEDSVAATYSNLVIGESETTFDITPTAAGKVLFTVTAAFEDDITQTLDYSLVVCETAPTYTVEAVEGATYGFTLNSNGYYESGNKAVNSSYAICKVVFNTQGLGLKLDCINYAEANFDYGLLSNLNTELALSNSADSSGVFKNFKGSSKADVQSVDYGSIATGENFIYVKFIKDGSGNSNNDSLQFKLNFY